MKENKTKTIQCCNCKKDIIVNINLSNNGTLCQECKNQGFKSPFRQKAQKTRDENNLKKYGVKNVQQIKSIKDKTNQTNLERYGGTGFAGSSKTKTIETIKEKYHTENIMKNEIGKETLRESMISKYGVSNPMQVKEFAQKSGETRTGVESKLKGKSYEEIFGIEEAKELKNKKSISHINKFLPSLKECLKNIGIEFLDEEYKGAHIKHRFKCLECDFEFTQIWNSLQQGYDCPKCNPRNQGISKAEIELQNFIHSLNIDFECKNKSILKGKELDIFVPSKMIAFEYNGLYWHSDLFRENVKYHLNKTQECLENNVRLIHIFEDEWIFKKEIVKNRIKNILNINEGSLVYARECIIKEIDSKTKNEFLEKYHIQGTDLSSIKLGCFYKDQLVSVMTFSLGNPSKGSKPEEGIYELNRFCTDYHFRVVGSFGKTLSYFKRNYQWTKIYSYVDRRWSTGNTYRILGFETNEKISLNYWYVKNFRRIHRFSLRKRPDEPKDIPEWLLRFSQGYLRIWDCGNLKFVLENK